MAFFPRFLAFALPFIAVHAHALTPNIDLRDLIRYGSAGDIQEARALLAQVNASPESFGIPAQLTYTTSALTQIAPNTVTTIEVQNGSDVFVVYSLDKQVWLNKVSLASGTPQVVSKTDLTRKPPQVQIDILNRQVTLSEPQSGFVKFFPVGVGALVNNTLGDASSGFRSLSSTFANATLSKSKSELSRTEPDFYKGRPFLRIISHESYGQFGGFTPFGMHYQISDSLQRGFVSNGCFRIRDNDLYELASIVFLSRKSGVPLSVVNGTTNGNRHPYPIINSWYVVPRLKSGDDGKVEMVTIAHGLLDFVEHKGDPRALLAPSSNQF